MKTLGEGIEDKAQLEHLQREQCDLGQGFLLARPLEAAAVGKFLTNVDPERSTVIGSPEPATIA